MSSDPQAPVMGRFEFARLSSLRAAQLMRGCIARVPLRHKRTTTAQNEIAQGKVVGIPFHDPRTNGTAK